MAALHRTSPEDDPFAGRVDIRFLSASNPGAESSRAEDPWWKRLDLLYRIDSPIHLILTESVMEE